MERRSFLGGLAGTPLAAGSGSAQTGKPRRRPPNVLFILFDKCRRDAFGAYGMKPVHTPNIDALAQDGVRFDTYYAPQGLCGPCRASIITGMYPHEHGMRKNCHPTHGRGQNSYHGRNPDPFHDERFHLWDNFPYVLHNAGYQTAHVGKWHLGPSNPGFFDTWRTFNSQMFHWIGKPHESVYRPDMQTDRGIEFINANADRPFFLYQSFYPPHPPWDPPRKYYEPYQGSNLEPKGYYETVTSLDWNVGRLVETLRKRKILDNTLIIVTTEHGMTLRKYPGTGVHGYSSPYDEVSRIPLVMHWPDGLPRGMVWNSGVGAVDLAPTIMDAAGAVGRLQGRYMPLEERSLLPDLQAKRDRWRMPLVMMNHCQRLYEGAYFEDRAIRTERWKLILRRFKAYSEGSPGSLHDMQADPEERNDLYGDPAHQETVADLSRQLMAWGERHGDPLAMELASRALMG